MKTTPSPFPDGVLLVNKPEGCTSFDVVRKIKPWVAPLKVGHTGTLDPMATGLLPLCLGEATKLVRFLSGSPKRYLATISLGVSTDTYDRDGSEVSRAPVPELADERILECLKSFQGEIQQVPPMYSALRHRGKRMHQLAREGIQVERQPRAVTIENLALTGMGPDWLKLDVTCSGGTYIRSLAHDIAGKLGTVGHLAALIRIETEGWTLDAAHDLDLLTKETLTDAVIPLEAVLFRFDRVDVDDLAGQRLEQGQHLEPAELESLGIGFPQKEKIVWFRPPAGRPLILAELKSQKNDRTTGMEILRVLLPTQ